MFNKTISFIKDLYGGQKFIPLHEPRFIGNEKKYVNEAIDSTFVSSVGKFVDDFEVKFAEFVGQGRCVVTSNGTSALHAALHLLGVGPGDEVITQALTFVATANAIAYCGARPIFLDSDRATLGLSPEALMEFLSEHAEVRGAVCFNKKTGRPIRCCVPMHVFGHPVRIDEIVKICDGYLIPVLEDAAESVGTSFQGVQTGLFGKVGVYSFNGNKIITSGGGGLIITTDEVLGRRAKHLTTTAKVPHTWDFYHDEMGFNYRMPNLNAALALAQLESLPQFIKNKRVLASVYQEFFRHQGWNFISEPAGAKSNYWLNAVLMDSKESRDAFLKESNACGVMTRPLWNLMTDLPMYKACQRGDLTVATFLQNHIVNIPSSVRL